MADYDTEFLAIWIIILTILHLENGKKIVIGCNCITVVSALLSLLCLWMGAGELLYYTENTDSCLKVTPFHTNAMIYTLSQTDNPEDQSILADEILEKNHYSSIAWTAKANEAFRRADMEECVRFQEKAILCDKYNIRRYCDYIDKLYVALQIYQREGNVEAETYCRNKMMTVHDLMQQVHESTDSMILPEQYQQLLQAISK